MKNGVWKTLEINGNEWINQDIVLNGVKCNEYKGYVVEFYTVIADIKS